MPSFGFLNRAIELDLHAINKPTDNIVAKVLHENGIDICNECGKQSGWHWCLDLGWDKFLARRLKTMNKILAERPDLRHKVFVALIRRTQ